MRKAQTALWVGIPNLRQLIDPCRSLISTVAAVLKILSKVLDWRGSAPDSALDLQLLRGRP